MHFKSSCQHIIRLLQIPVSVTMYTNLKKHLFFLNAEFGVHLAELTVDPQGALAIRQVSGFYISANHLSMVLCNAWDWFD